MGEMIPLNDVDWDTGVTADDGISPVPVSKSMRLHVGHVIPAVILSKPSTELGVTWRSCTIIRKPLTEKRYRGTCLDPEGGWSEAVSGQSQS